MKKQAIVCGFVCAAVGFCVAVYVANTPPSLSMSIWLQAIIAYILCPPAIFAGMSATDPDAGSIWFFFAPINALIYGFAGFLLWRKCARHLSSSNGRTKDGE